MLCYLYEDANYTPVRISFRDRGSWLNIYIIVLKGRNMAQRQRTCRSTYSVQCRPSNKSVSMQCQSLNIFQLPYLLYTVWITFILTAHKLFILTDIIEINKTRSLWDLSTTLGGILLYPSRDITENGLSLQKRVVMSKYCRYVYSASRIISPHPINLATKQDPFLRQWFQVVWQGDPVQSQWRFVLRTLRHFSNYEQEQFQKICLYLWQNYQMIKFVFPCSPTNVLSSLQYNLYNEMLLQSCLL